MYNFTPPKFFKIPSINKCQLIFIVTARIGIRKYKWRYAAVETWQFRNFFGHLKMVFYIENKSHQTYESSIFYTHFLSVLFFSKLHSVTKVSRSTLANLNGQQSHSLYCSSRHSTGWLGVVELILRWPGQGFLNPMRTFVWPLTVQLF